MTELENIISGVSIDIVHPATAEMNNNEIESLILELHDVASDAFGKYISIDAIDERTRGIDYVLVIRDKSGRAVGYASNEILKLNGYGVNYFASALIRSEYQGKGIYSSLKDVRVSMAQTDILMTRTQNPKVYRWFNQLCTEYGYEMYPNGHGVTQEVIDLARSYCPKTDESLIVKNAYYGESLMKNTPKPIGFHEEKVFAGFDVKAGDAVILIGKK